MWGVLAYLCCIAGIVIPTTALAAVGAVAEANHWNVGTILWVAIPVEAVLLPAGIVLGVFGPDWCWEQVRKVGKRMSGHENTDENEAFLRSMWTPGRTIGNGLVSGFASP